MPTLLPHRFRWHCLPQLMMAGSKMANCWHSRQLVAGWSGGRLWSALDGPDAPDMLVTGNAETLLQAG
jgi:hypothetical protein